MREGEEEEKEERKKMKKNKMKIIAFDFLDCDEK